MTSRGSRVAAVLLAAPLLLAAAVPAAAGERSIQARKLIERAGDKRPDDQLSVELFGRPLVVGGEFEVETRYRDDFKLSPGEKDDDLNMESKLELEFLYQWSPTLVFFAEGKLGYEHDTYSEDGLPESEWKPQRGETWIYLDDVSETGLSFQLGRQNLKDGREWWWDEDLDAARLVYEFGNSELELAVARELGPVQANRDDVAPELEDVFFALGHYTWYWGKKSRLELFAVHRSDHSRTPRLGSLLPEEREDAFDGNLTWVGARAIGRWKYRPLGRFHYWLDGAAVRGRETELDFNEIGNTGVSEVEGRAERDVFGWAVDGGVTWDPERSFWPRLTLGYAYGSGDDGVSGTDHAFRQTGLQDNNAKFRGVDRFKYYGELFRPELSNLHILTVSAGVPLLESSSLELVYHAYWQAEAAPFLRNSKLKASPEGRHRALGHEWDLVLGIEEGEHWEFELVGSVFRAGKAFADEDRGEWAQLVLFKVDYNF